HYKYVVNATRSEFSEEALARLSQIVLEAKSWREAIPYLRRLENEADFPQNIIFAQSNLMKAYFEVDNPEKTIEYSEKVLQKSNIDNKVRSDAHVFMARTAIKINDEDKARSAYQEVEKIATGSLAAEALYYNAYFKHKDGQYKASNTKVQKLAKDYSGYKYYGAKGLIVMAKNYYALDDAYQATYILESVISNFSEFDDVVAEARSELNRIKTEEAKTNSSVQKED
ncbi:MAG: hypothetical protein KJN66_08840, partial [Bacteroidia bacterium]|nr:hypothetical protein [Bacteroidia bacterium]